MADKGPLVEITLGFYVQSKEQWNDLLDRINALDADTTLVDGLPPEWEER